MFICLYPNLWRFSPCLCPFVSPSAPPIAGLKAGLRELGPNPLRTRPLCSANVATRSGIYPIVSLVMSSCLAQLAWLVGSFR